MSEMSNNNRIPTVAELLASPEAYQQGIGASVFGADLTAAMCMKKASKSSNTQSKVKKTPKAEGLTAAEWDKVESDSSAILEQLFGPYSDFIRKSGN